MAAGGQTTESKIVRQLFGPLQVPAVEYGLDLFLNEIGRTDVLAVRSSEERESGEKDHVLFDGVGLRGQARRW